MPKQNGLTLIRYTEYWRGDGERKASKERLAMAMSPKRLDADRRPGTMAAVDRKRATGNRHRRNVRGGRLWRVEG